MKTGKRLLAAMLIVLMLMTSVPMTGYVGLELGTKAEAASYKVGDRIQFGNYPQSQVKDTSLIKKLNNTNTEWKYYSYYIEGKPSNYMKYRDVTFSGSKYRAVSFSKYRPYSINKSSSDYSSNQDDNGYYVNTTYWFKYEPISWRILDAQQGLVLSEMILDSQEYSPFETRNINGETVYSTNYEYSAIRSWLNTSFYNIAFTNFQKQNILTTHLDNYVYGEFNSRDCDDNVFVLSYSDAVNNQYGFAKSSSSTYDSSKRASGTDYSKAQGLRIDSDNFLKNSSWFLRTPINGYSIQSIDWYGYFSYIPMTSSSTEFGVRPACCLKVLKNDTNIDSSINGDSKSKLNVYIDRATFTYYEGESFYICASIESNGKTIKPTKLKVTSSDASVVKPGGVYDPFSNPVVKKVFQNNSTNQLSKIKTSKEALLTNTLLCVLNPKKEGRASITVKCDEIKDARTFDILVLKDNYAKQRADKFQSEKFSSPDSYCFTGGGMYIENFKCAKQNEKYKITMDVFNRMSCYGAIEVYDSNDKLIYVDMIKKSDYLPTSLADTASAGWNLISDAWNSAFNKTQYHELKTVSKKTTLSFDVPIDGSFIITNDSAQSECCYMYNMMDVFMDTFFLTKDVIDTVDPTPDVKQDKQATEQAIKESVKKFIYKEAKRKYVKKYLGKLSKSVGLEFTLSVACDYLVQLKGTAETFFKTIDISLTDFVKACTKTGVSLAESCFLQWLEVSTGGASKAISGALAGNSAINLGREIKHFLFDTFAKSYTIKLLAPADSSLPKPTNLKATSINTVAINLRWDKVKNATGYVVYQYNKSTKKYKRIDTTKKNIIKIQNLNSGTTYQFAVRSYRKTSGKTDYSPYSKTITVTTKKG